MRARALQSHRSPVLPRDAHPKEGVLAYVRRRLGESKTDSGGEGWKNVSEQSGVRYDTISRIHRGAIVDPCISKLQPLIDYYFDRVQ